MHPTIAEESFVAEIDGKQKETKFAGRYQMFRPTMTQSMPSTLCG